MCRLSADRLQRAMYPSYQILCVAGCSEAYLTSMSTNRPTESILFAQDIIAQSCRWARVKGHTGEGTVVCHANMNATKRPRTSVQGGCLIWMQWWSSSWSKHVISLSLFHNQQNLGISYGAWPTRLLFFQTATVKSPSLLLTTACVKLIIQALSHTLDWKYFRK